MIKNLCRNKKSDSFFTKVYMGIEQTCVLKILSVQGADTEG